MKILFIKDWKDKVKGDRLINGSFIPEWQKLIDEGFAVHWADKDKPIIEKEVITKKHKK